MNLHNFVSSPKSFMLNLAFIITRNLNTHIFRYVLENKSYYIFLQIGCIFYNTLSRVCHYYNDLMI